MHWSANWGSKLRSPNAKTSGCSFNRAAVARTGQPQTPKAEPGHAVSQHMETNVTTLPSHQPPRLGSLRHAGLSQNKREVEVETAANHPRVGLWVRGILYDKELETWRQARYSGGAQDIN